MISKLPDKLRETPEFALLNPEAGRKVYNIIQLIYRSKQHEGESKDFEFSSRSMADHWSAGLNDTVRTLRHPEVLGEKAVRMSRTRISCRSHLLPQHKWTAEDLLGSAAPAEERPGDRLPCCLDSLA